MKFQDVCEVCFLIMGSSNGQGLSQLYLELVDAYKKRFMPQNRPETLYLTICCFFGRMHKTW